MLGHGVMFITIASHGCVFSFLKLLYTVTQAALAGRALHRIGEAGMWWGICVRERGRVFCIVMAIPGSNNIVTNIYMYCWEPLHSMH